MSYQLYLSLRKLIFYYLFIFLIILLIETIPPLVNAQTTPQPTGQPTGQPTVFISSSSSLRKGLVAYYPFNGNANDKSGNGINGITRGGVTLTTDRFGTANSAYNLDGTSGYIEFPGKQFNFVQNMTVAFWLNHGGLSVGNTLLDKSTSQGSQSSSVHYGGWAIRQVIWDTSQTDTFEFYYINSTNSYARSFLPVYLGPSTWFHLAFTLKSNRLTIYVNGNQHSTSKTISTFLPNGNYPLLMGAVNYGNTIPASNVGGFHNGKFDELMIYNRSLSADEIRQLYSFDSPTSQPTRQPSRQPTSQPSREPTAQPTRQPSQQPTMQPTGQPSSLPTMFLNPLIRLGLIAFYPFSVDATDHSGNGNHGALRGSVTPTTDRFGHVNSAFYFDGSSAYIEIPGQQFNFANNMSISFWVQPAETQVDWAVLVTKSQYSASSGGPLGSFVVQQQSNTLNGIDFFYLISGSTYSAPMGTSRISLSQSVWNHVVITKGNNIVKYYLNGIQQPSTVVGTSSHIVPNGNAPLTIGAANGAATPPAGSMFNYFKGAMDEFAFFNRTLSTSEIIGLYQFEIPTGQPSSQPTSQPFGRPSTQPSCQPTSKPSSQPSSRPTRQPTRQPMSSPTSQPSTQPTNFVSASLKTGLVAYYPLDGNALDKSGNSNNGIFLNSGKWVADQFGNPQGAFTCSSSSCIQVKYNPTLDFSNNFTIALWYRPYTNSGLPWTKIINSGVFGGFGWEQTNTNNNEFYAYYYQPASSVFGGVFTIPYNVWIHLAVVKTNTLVKIYVNNIPTASFSGTDKNVAYSTDKNLYLGSNGTLDEVFVYNRPLSKSEVAALYYFGAPSSQPSSQPTRQPTGQPNCRPTSQPTGQPTLLVPNVLKAGLVAYYPFDQASAIDSSDNNHDGVNFQVVAGKDRHGNAVGAAYYDGSPSFTYIPGDPFNFHSHDMAISMWLKIDSFAYDDCYVLSKTFQGLNTGGWYLQKVPLEQLYFNFIPENNLNAVGLEGSVFAVTFDAWNHVVISKQSNVKIYVNGTLTAQFDYSFPAISTTEVGLMVGSTTDSTVFPPDPLSPCIQWVDDLFFFNRSLTTRDVNDLYHFHGPSPQPSSMPTAQPSVPTSEPSSQPTDRIPIDLKSGLVAMYPFNGNALDRSGNDIHGLAISTTPTTDRFGAANQALYFDGLLSYAFVPGEYFNFNTHPMTISIWVNPASSQFNDAFVFTKSHGSFSIPHGGFWVQQNGVANSNAYVFNYFVPTLDSFSLPTSTPMSLPPNHWTLITIVKDSVHVRWYLNSTKVQIFNISNEKIISNGVLPLMFGAANGAESLLSIPQDPFSFFHGKLDDVFIYNRSLSDADVQELFTLGERQTMQPTGLPTRQPSSHPTGQPVSHPSAQPSSAPSTVLFHDGLVAYYPFDGDCNDRGPNGNNGQPSLSISYVSNRNGQSNHAVYFNGGAYISIPGNDFNFLFEMSIAFWIKPNSSPDWLAVFDKSHYMFETGNSGGWYVYTSTGQHVIYYHTARDSNNQLYNAGGSTKTILTYDEWSHIVITRNHTAITYYKNGVLVEVAPSLTPMIPNNYPLVIGKEFTVYSQGVLSNDCCGFVGALDEVYIYNRSLSAVEAHSLYSLIVPTASPTVYPTSQPSVFINSRIRSGLVAFYPFDNGQAKDISGNHNNGVIHGGVTATTDRYFVSSGALEFNGVTGYVEIPGRQFNFINDYSISFWVRCTASQTDWNHIFDKSIYVNGGYVNSSWYVIQFAENTNMYSFNYVKQYDEAAVDYYRSSFLVNDNTWEHMSATKHNDVIVLYQNGVFVQEISIGSLSTTNLRPNGDLPLIIGAGNKGGTNPASDLWRFFNGALDDIMIFNRTLSAQEVLSLYNYEIPTSQPSGQPTSRPTAYNANLKKGLVAKYLFEGNANDNSRHGHNGVARYGVAVTTDRNNVPGKAYLFDGKNGFVEAPGAPFQFDGNFSFSLWIAPNSSQVTGSTIISSPSPYFAGGPGEWGLRMEASHVNKYSGYIIDADVSFQSTSSHQIAPFLWTHVAVVKEANTMLLYVNGTFASRTIISGSGMRISDTFSSNKSLIIGGLDQSGSMVRLYSGKIDDVYIFNRSLSANEIFQLFTFETSTHFPTSQPSSQPSSKPSVRSSSIPSGQPNASPTGQPSGTPSSLPSPQPSRQPSGSPSGRPTSHPSSLPSGQPIACPSAQPTAQPSAQPACHPSSHPTTQPSSQPSQHPSAQPSALPLSRPTSEPSGQPTNQPTVNPSAQPSTQPTTQPVTFPTSQPTRKPSTEPSALPSGQPNSSPTGQPSGKPSSLPSSQPSRQPSSSPSRQPSSHPSSIPSRQPIACPSGQPTSRPTTQPSSQPSVQPSTQPTAFPVSVPSAQPTKRPSSQPSSKPSVRPVVNPTTQPTTQPTRQPTGQPSSQPSSHPFSSPSTQPTVQPSSQPSTQPSSQPSRQPSVNPSVHPFPNPTSQPSSNPASQPSSTPSAQPIVTPSTQPTTQPTIKPSGQPSSQPSSHPFSRPSTVPTMQPSAQPSSHPSSFPRSTPTTQPSTRPSSQPSRQPSTYPSAHPFSGPTSQPSETPSSQPSARPSSPPSPGPISHPSSQPTAQPSVQPSAKPSSRPLSSPTIRPGSAPTTQPTSHPTVLPNSKPSYQPSARPSSQPSLYPSKRPTTYPSTQPSSQPSCLPVSHPSTAPSCTPSLQPSESLTAAQPSNRPYPSPICRSSSSPLTSPSAKPSSQPSGRPSGRSPIESPTKPTSQPSSQPSSFPSACPSVLQSSRSNGSELLQPSVYPSFRLSGWPTSTPSLLASKAPSTPSGTPSVVPSAQPSGLPSTFSFNPPSSPPTLLHSLCSSTELPTTIPSTRMPTSDSPTHSFSESNAPSVHPSQLPSINLTLSSSSPTLIGSYLPSLRPSEIAGSDSPISSLSLNPSQIPSTIPNTSLSPSNTQSFNLSSPSPTQPPSLVPSINFTSRSPSFQPAEMEPTPQPSTSLPSSLPSSQPSQNPSSQPFSRPTRQPTSQPSSQPSRQPATHPSAQPTISPSISPTSRPTRIPTERTLAPTPVRPPSITAYPSTTVKPTRIPSLRPSRSPTIAPTSAFSIISSGLSNSLVKFQANLFFLGSFLPDNIITNKNLDLTSSTIGSSYVIFGGSSKQKHFSDFTIDACESIGYFTKIQGSSMFGLHSDSMTRSITKLGDVNGDSFADLILCSPMGSICYLFMGRSTSESFVNIPVSLSVSVLPVGERSTSTLFGWSVAEIGDFNRDGLNDFMISSLLENIVYVIYGQSDWITSKEVVLSQRNSSNYGFRLRMSAASSSHLSNLGIGLANAYDFNGDGATDIFLTATKLTTSQNILFVVYGKDTGLMNDVILSHLNDPVSSKKYLRIIAPVYSFAGFSITGIGDLNGDNFADIAIGSVPYQGGYLPQRTYILYGRNDSLQEISLSSLTATDGFIVTGGGFFVAGPGDLNGDGYPDLMVTSYSSWQGKINSYFLVFPSNVSSPQTYQPSSQPSALPSSRPSSSPSILRMEAQPTNRPTLSTNSPVETIPPTNTNHTFPPNIPATAAPSRAPVLTTSKPSRRPSASPTTRTPSYSPSKHPSLPPSLGPTRVPSTIPSAAPVTKKPSKRPTARPTRFIAPSSHPSLYPTFSASTIENVDQYDQVTISASGEYDLPAGNQKVTVSDAAVGNVIIQGNDGRKVYVITPIPLSSSSSVASSSISSSQSMDSKGSVPSFSPSSPPSSSMTIIILDFHLHYHVLDLTLFAPEITSISDVSYVTNPLTIILSSRQTIVLPGHDHFDLSTQNFLFQSKIDSSSKKWEVPFVSDSSFLISISLLVFFALMVVGFTVAPTMAKTISHLDILHPHYLHHLGGPHDRPGIRADCRDGDDEEESRTEDYMSEEVYRRYLDKKKREEIEMERMRLQHAKMNKTQGKMKKDRRQESRSSSSQSSSVHRSQESRSLSYSRSFSGSSFVSGNQSQDEEAGRSVDDVQEGSNEVSSSASSSQDEGEKELDEQDSEDRYTLSSSSSNNLDRPVPPHYHPHGHQHHAHHHGYPHRSSADEDDEESIDFSLDGSPDENDERC